MDSSVSVGVGVRIHVGKKIRVGSAPASDDYRRWLDMDRIHIVMCAIIYLEIYLYTPKIFRKKSTLDYSYFIF